MTPAMLLTREASAWTRCASLVGGIQWKKEAIFVWIGASSSIYCGRFAARLCEKISRCDWATWSPSTVAKMCHMASASTYVNCYQLLRMTCSSHAQTQHLQARVIAKSLHANIKGCHKSVGFAYWWHAGGHYWEPFRRVLKAVLPGGVPPHP